MNTTHTIHTPEIIYNGRSGIIATDAHTRAKAQAILEDYIGRAKARAAQPIERILTEVPTDHIAQGAVLDFDTGTDGRARVKLGADGSPLVLHDNALSQFADKAGIGMTYLRHLQEQKSPWAQSLLAHTLKEHAHEVLPSERFLVRSHAGQARAMLSDRFRRIDCRPGLDALLGESQKVGALVSDAVVTDVRASVRVLIPRVLEVSPGEFIVLGLAWANSDYGKGAQSLALFALRVWCLNGATLEQEMRQVHLGGRLTDWEIRYSERTIAADSRATTLAMRDTARALLSPAHMERTTDMIRTAASQAIDVKGKTADLRKRLGKTLADRIAETYTSADVEALPPGNTAWRLSNAISWVAKQDDVDAETRLDLEKEAGAALGKRATA